MTRDFSKDQRDDRRPYARHASTGGQHPNQGSSKPARPRLSRDAVDRAWENGATRKYADYRPLQNSQPSAGQRPGRPGSSFERSRQPQNRAAYNARSKPFHSPSPSSHQGYQTHGASSSERGPRNSYGADRHGSDRQNWQPERRGRDTRSSSFEAGRGRGPYQPDRSPRSAQHNRSDAPTRSYRENTPRSFDRSHERFERSNQRDHAAPYRSQDTRPFERGERPERSARPFQNGYHAPDRSNYRAQDTRPFERGERPERSARPFQNGYGAPDRSNYRAQDTRPFERNERPERSARPFQNSYHAPDRPNSQEMRSFEHDEHAKRSPRPFQNGYHAPDRPNYRTQSTRPERPVRTSQANRKSGSRPNSGPARRDTYNPRWQSRPNAQAQARHEPHIYARPEAEQFEGDYERFDAANQGQPDTQSQNALPHVTRLPDGRVLKGSRPEQRKQARFWTDVTSEAATLVPKPRPAKATPSEQPPVPAAETASETVQPAHKGPNGTTRVVRTVKTSRSGQASSRAAKVARRSGKKKATDKPAGPILRPSQRGFKWPAPPTSQE